MLVPYFECFNLKCYRRLPAYFVEKNMTPLINIIILKIKKLNTYTKKKKKNFCI